jgi:hypothetical protein
MDGVRGIDPTTKSLLMHDGSLVPIARRRWGEVVRRVAP